MFPKKYKINCENRKFLNKWKKQYLVYLDYHLENTLGISCSLRVPNFQKLGG